MIARKILVVLVYLICVGFVWFVLAGLLQGDRLEDDLSNWDWSAVEWAFVPTLWIVLMGLEGLAEEFDLIDRRKK